jgi:hypothetical protein
MANGFGKSRVRAPEEGANSRKVPRGGAEKRHEGGFREGEMGRGPTPYKKSHSHRNGAGMDLNEYEGTAGRGGGGIIGKSDNFKAHSEDIEHPQSHADFERLGHSED